MSAPPPPPPLAPLPPGWTEHRAPAGQPYWFNPSTNVSTYIRPALPAPPPPPPGFHHPPHPAHPLQPLQPIHYAPGQAPPVIGQPQPVAVPAAAKKEKREKPKEKVAVPGTEWVRVTTNKGNVFYTNKETKASLWTVPDEIKDQVDAMDKEAKEAAAAAAAEAETSVVNGVGKKRKAEAVEAATEPPAAEDDDTQPDEGTPDEEPEVVKDVPEASASPAPATAPEPAAATEPEPEPEAPPKPKKAKRKVVTEIEELEKDEDWQRRVAEEMAKEVEEQDQEQAKLAEAEPVAPPQPAPAKAAANRFEGTPEEAAAVFKAMLAEKDIQPMAPWDMELPKFVNDPRYTAVRQLKDRRDLFDEFCKVKIREQRAAKKAALEGGVKVDPVIAYRALLAAEVTSTRTHFSDFKRAHAKDPRFREFGKTEGEKEKVFRAWLRELGEKKRVEAEKAEAKFREMLSEDGHIRPGDKWADVKVRYAKDRRYDGVNSSSLRESLFNKYLASLTSGGPPAPSTSASTSQPPAPTKADRAARAAAALREREDQIRHEQARSQRSAQAARGAAGREEAEREFGQLLIDHVRDHEARWEDVVDGLRRDPRFEHPALQFPHDHRRLFDQHLSALYSKRLAQLEAVFLQHAPLLTTPFSSIEEDVLEAPQAQRLVGKDARRLEALYDHWLARRTSKARDEFQELLKENSVLEHWGRLQKKEGAQDGAIEVKADDEEEEEADAPDLREMAGQVGVREIEHVLKNDRRYLVWAHEPALRTGWVEEYLRGLAPPKQTVHQKD